MQNNSLEIKLAGIQDLEPLRDVSIQTFTQAFAAVNSEEDMALYLRQKFSVPVFEKELRDPDVLYFMVCVDQQPAGYLKLNTGAAQTEFRQADSLEVERIYVLSEQQGRNIGQLLFDKALHTARERGMKWVWLGVWENNHGAIRFYERNGFQVFDKHAFILGNDKQTDLLMKLML